MMFDRRTVVTGAMALAAAPAFAKDPRVNFTVPDGACDCHHHIYDPRFPYQPNAVLKPPYATVQDYRAVQKKLGTSRNVMVQPSTYGTDNSCLLDVLAQMGDAARAVCVVNASVTDAELKKLHAAGVRGVRIQFGLGNPVAADEVLPLAKRIASLGWHIQTNMPAEQLVAMESLLLSLPCPVIVDHLGRATDIGQPQYDTVRRLLQSGHGWVKLSGAYLYGGGTAPGYAGASRAAKGYIATAPDRCVWGSDWPHPDATKTLNPVAMPDDVTLIDLVPGWVPDEKLRHRILVENPEKFYGFDPKQRPKAL
ncbi:MAG: 2-pyrone-4,6-dicarboxylate hydrolase [Alphaproteobacteria bacterium]|jgi:D-galactarolactone isomerase|nr:2-pyrone-4,6-dicarboxylate hydrolase [Alphaproteobacteria bacterium]